MKQSRISRITLKTQTKRELEQDVLRWAQSYYVKIVEPITRSGRFYAITFDEVKTDLTYNNAPKRRS
jgi:hypothetical protein